MNGPTARGTGRLRPLLALIPPERAHALALGTLGLLSHLPGPKLTAPAALRCEIAGLPMAHPVGRAAGFDKNARAVKGLFRLGCAAVEIGTVTPRPQAGNPRPRLFRLMAEEAVINRMGFNNDGMEAVAGRLARLGPDLQGPLGANLGSNRDSPDPKADYVLGLRRLGPLVDYVTVNVSSPNTPGLRALQKVRALRDLMTVVLEARAEVVARRGRPLPVFLKIAPDLLPEEEAGIVEVVGSLPVDALVIGNTTLSRPSWLDPARAAEAGGLSGRPLFPRSTRLLARFALRLEGAVPLIGVGGIATGADAYMKIRAGASAVQLYTALVHRGPNVVRRILDELALHLAADGFETVAQAVGTSAGMLAEAPLDRRQHVT